MDFTARSARNVWSILSNSPVNNSYGYLKANMITKTIEIILCQMLFTFGCVALTLIPAINKIIVDNCMANLAIGFIGAIMMSLYMSYAPKKTEMQLAIFTIFETMVIYSISAMYGYNTVVLAVLATLGLSAALSIYAISANTDHVGLYSILYSSLTCSIIISFANLFFNIPLIDLIELYTGTLIFFGYIIVDVQYYFSDKYDYYNFPSDIHISAAFNIYLDFVNIFIRMLEIIRRYRTDKKKL